MVSGQKEEKKKHLARLTKLFELTCYLQILKMVDGERAGWGRGVHLSKQAAEEHEEALVYVFSARELWQESDIHRETYTY